MAGATDAQGAMDATSRGVPPILLMEDEAALAESLQFSLNREGFEVLVAADGEAGIERFRAERPSLVLLDLMLPKLNGFDVCRIVRAESNVPIIILSAKDSEADRVAGLEIGADDYVTKPFSLRELVSRLRAHLRRAGLMTRTPQAHVLSAGDVELDLAQHAVRVRGQPVALTPKEFALLETFLRSPDRLRTRTHLIDRVWGSNYFGDTKTLDVHVKRLRAKIERDPHHPAQLLTVRGLGYRFLSRSE